METSTGSQWKTSREVLIFSQTWHGCESPYIGWCMEYGMTKICGLSWGMLCWSFFVVVVVVVVVVLFIPVTTIHCHEHMGSQRSQDLLP